MKLITPILAISIAFGFTAPDANAGGDETKVRSFIVDQNKNKIFEDDLIALIKRKLSDADGPLYKDLHIMIDACKSGGFVDEARAKLKGKWSTTSSTNSQYPSKWDETSKLEDDFRLRCGNCRGGYHRYNSHGFKIGGLYSHGFSAQWAKKLKAANGTTLKDLYEEAKSNNYQGYGEAKIGGNGQTSNLIADAKSYHGALWVANHKKAAKSGVNVAVEMYKVLNSNGYKNEGNSLELAVWKKKGKTWGKSKTAIDENATLAGLNNMLDTIRAGLLANRDKEKAFIYMTAHGSTARKKAPKKDNAQDNQPNQGRSCRNGYVDEISLDSDFVESLMEEITVNDKEIHRVGPATFMVATTEETFAGPVTIFFDNYPIGEITLIGDGNRVYELEIADESLNDLYQGGMFDDLEIEVGFQFVADGENNFFRFATEWDRDLEIVETYGYALASPPISGLADNDIPEVLTPIDFEVRRGELQEGDLAALLKSDGENLIVCSERGEAFTKPFITEILSRFESPVTTPEWITLYVESSISEPAGIATVKLRNWSTGSFDTIETYLIGTTTGIDMSDVIDTSNYVRRSDGMIEVSVENVVIATFLPDHFDSIVDQIQLLVKR